MNDEKKSDIITPCIDGQEVTSLKINEKAIPLKEPMPIEFFFKDFIPAFGVIEAYLDLSGVFQEGDVIEEWNDEELSQFLLDLSPDQRDVIKVINKEAKISRIDLIKELNANRNEDNIIGSKKLAGILAALNRKINKKNREKFFLIGGDYYRINEKYINTFNDIV